MDDVGRLRSFGDGRCWLLFVKTPIDLEEREDNDVIVTSTETEKHTIVWSLTSACVPKSTLRILGLEAGHLDPCRASRAARASSSFSY